MSTKCSCIFWGGTYQWCYLLLPGLIFREFLLSCRMNFIPLPWLTLSPLLGQLSQKKNGGGGYIYGIIEFLPLSLAQSNPAIPPEVSWANWWWWGSGSIKFILQLWRHWLPWHSSTASQGYQLVLSLPCLFLWLVELVITMVRRLVIFGWGIPGPYVNVMEFGQPIR